jgi:hypothetical protein
LLTIDFGPDIVIVERATATSLTLSWKRPINGVEATGFLVEVVPAPAEPAPASAATAAASSTQTLSKSAKAKLEAKALEAKAELALLPVPELPYVVVYTGPDSRCVAEVYFAVVVAAAAAVVFGFGFFCQVMAKPCHKSCACHLSNRA